MSLHDDLLDQAELLARYDDRKPKQANLRRAVSSAYDSLFHKLVDAATRLLLSGPNRAWMRELVARAFAHSEMKAAAKSFAGGTLKQRLSKASAGRKVPGDLMTLAKTFVDLQELRHEADYDPASFFYRRDVEEKLFETRMAFEAWDRVCSDPMAELFLVTLLTHKRLSNR